MTGGIAYREGDATAPEGPGQKIIAHVCNDAGGWGRGFVTALSRRWPAPEEDYRDWFRSGADFRLGALRLVGVAPGIHVANMVAQHGYRSVGGRPPIRYEALRECLGVLAADAARMGAAVHMPRIGCGLAGGRWEEVEPLLRGTLVAAGIMVTVWDLPHGAGLTRAARAP